MYAIRNVEKHPPVQDVSDVLKNFALFVFNTIYYVVYCSKPVLAIFEAYCTFSPVIIVRRYQYTKLIVTSDVPT